MSDKTVYSYINDIAQRLKEPRKYGDVSLMIGAGFSKNAQSKGRASIQPPNWSELAEKMYEELYPEPLEEQEKEEWNRQRIIKTSGKNVTKLADEYIANFDRNKINNLIEQSIADEMFVPGELHKRLLKLHWSDIFTTNYDNLIEKALEKNHIDYFDGFSGRINPKFSTANYGKLICKQNGFQGRLTEEVSVNLYKIHGSLYWKEEKDDIVFDDFNERINNISAAKENQEDFLENYSKLAIINPEKNKFNSTVMNSNYYDQIRMFANDMERQNAILLSFGFSFADEHILQIIDRALGTNPTLTLLLFPYCQEDLEKFNEIFESRNNVYCYYKKQQDKGKIDNFTLENMNELLMEIYNGIK